MIRIFKIALFFLGLLFLSCTSHEENSEAYLPSPDSRIHIYFYLNNGEPYYLIFQDDEIIIDWSILGFQLSNDLDLTRDLVLVDTKTKTDEIKASFTDLDTNLIKGDYNEMTFCLESKKNPTVGFDLVMRSYNEGIAFRYILKGNDKEMRFQILSEETVFSLYADIFTWNETQDTLDLPAIFNAEKRFEVIFDQSVITSYPKMVLIKKSDDKHRFRSYLGNSLEIHPLKLETGVKSPWRIITIKEIINQNKDE